MYVINNTFHTSIKNTPSKIFLGYDKENHDDASLAELVNSLTRVDGNSEKETRKKCGRRSHMTTPKL